MPSETAPASRRWLADILYHIDLAQTFTANLTYENFRDDLQKLYAVTRCLEIISEPSHGLPDELKARHPAIAWRNMAAAGNVYRHEYEDVAARRVWDAVQLALPPLRTVLELKMQALKD